MSPYLRTGESGKVEMLRGCLVPSHESSKQTIRPRDISIWASCAVLLLSAPPWRGERHRQLLPHLERRPGLSYPRPCTGRIVSAMKRALRMTFSAESAESVSRSTSFFLFDQRQRHSSALTADLSGHRAQRRSRVAALRGHAGVGLQPSGATILMQDDRPAPVEADDMERVLADIDRHIGDLGVDLLHIAVLLRNPVQHHALAV